MGYLTRILAGSLICGLALPLAADEGMWLFGQFPQGAAKQKHEFDATPQFLDSLRQATVRIAAGSGSFVSPNGLLLTNQHLLTKCLSSVSSAPHDYLKDGFYAASQADEVRCPGLEAQVLISTEEVTKQVRGAAKDNTPAAQALQARNSAIAKLEQECAMRSGNRCSVVKLFSGARYDLYQYKPYTDLRLVFAPENALAFFGRQRDSITYLRYGLDIAFVRAYENGRPAATPHFLKWNIDGVKEDDLVLSAGNPAATMRLSTSAQLGFYRDNELPAIANRLRTVIQRLSEFAGQSPSNLAAAEPVLTDLLETYKSAAGMLIGLKDDRLATRKTLFESKIRRAVQGSSKLGVEATKVWDEVATAYKNWGPSEREYQILEGSPALGSSLYRAAKEIVRLSEERSKPADQRLTEFRGSAFDAAQAQLSSTIPINDDLETVALTQYLDELSRAGGGGRGAGGGGGFGRGGGFDRGGLDGPGGRGGPGGGGRGPGPANQELPMKAILGSKSSRDAATEMVKSTRLKDPAERKRLSSASHEELLKSTDPLIRMAVLLDDPALKLRKRRDDLIGALETSASEKIAQYRLQLFKDAEYPDGTGSARVELGVIKAYTDRAGVAMPAASTFGGLYYRRDNQGPYAVPQRWVDAKSSLNMLAPLDFVSTIDIGGGDPGAPVVNRSGELVGVTFDGNLESLPAMYLYTDEQARAVHVSTAGIMEALQKVYRAKSLLQELGLPASPAGGL